jgi:BRCT domain type II-containing protein
MRSDAWQFVVNHGGRINNSMTAKTTCLVVGGYGGAFTEGYLSNKHKKALDMQAAGKKITIISDKEFLELTRDIAAK